MTKTEEIVVWLADEPDGTEGIMAMLDPRTGMMMPMFATRGGPSEATIDERAKFIALASGRTCRKALFRRAEDVAIITP
jgi:hypothetical protein